MYSPKNINELELYFRKENIFELLGINKIGVFGSFARNEHFNDIDILLDDDVNVEKLVLIQEKINKDLDVPVDIVLSKYAEPIILLRAKRDLQYVNLK